MGNGVVGAGKIPSPSEPLDVAHLLVRARSRTFPSITAWEQDFSSSSSSSTSLEVVELWLFLENARYVAGQPSVRASVCDQAEGRILGRVAEWPAKRCNESPSWFSAQSLGIPMNECESAILRLELWDRRRLLGSVSVPFCDMHVSCRQTRTLDATAFEGLKSSTLSFQVIDSRTVLGKRTVFFIRHAESVWNAAQRRRNYREMACTTDHPLSASGRQQAETLAVRLQASKQSDPVVASMLSADAVFVSPLTRAVQTAVIALGAVMTECKVPGELVLVPNAREKKNRGGFDCISNKLGGAIVQHVVEETRLLYKGHEDGIFQTMKRLRYDVEEVQDLWCEGAVESGVALDARLDEFMSQLLYSPHRTIIVVGHSQFFQLFCNRFVSNEFMVQNPELAQQLTKQKLENCGVVRLALDPSRALRGGPILEAETILNDMILTEGAHTTSLEMNMESESSELQRKRRASKCLG